MGKIQLLLADPDRLVREGIKKLLPDSVFVVVEDTNDLQGVLKYIENGGRPDIILTELSNEGEWPIATLEAVRSAAPEARIVALNNGISGPTPAEALKAGLSGLLTKDISPRIFVHALELVGMGEKIFPIHSDFLVAPQGGERCASVVRETRPIDLSDREMNVLRGLAGGLSNKLIAREINVTETTVKAHVKTILRKINAENRTQAAVWCLGNGVDHRPPLEVTVRPQHNGAHTKNENGARAESTAEVTVEIR